MNLPRRPPMGQRKPCRHAGMDDSLVKPVSLAELAQRLDHSLPLTATAELIDHQLLERYSMGDRGRELELLWDFRRTNDHDAELLRQAVRVGDFAQISHFAHRIAGACLMLGVTQVSATCQRIELDSRAGDLMKVSSEHASLQEQLHHLDRYLDHKVS